MHFRQGTQALHAECERFDEDDGVAMICYAPHYLYDGAWTVTLTLEDGAGTAFTAEGATLTAQTGLTESQAQAELRALAAKRENKPVLVRGRRMEIPSETKEIAVSGDMNSTTVTFRIDTYYDGFDLSTHNLYVEMM